MENTIHTPTQSKKHDATIAIRLYAYLLKLYPASFREAFGDEMQEVFALALLTAFGVSQMAAVWVVVRELINLPLSLWQIRRDAFNQMSAIDRRVEQARWFVRIIALLLGTFLLSTLRLILSPSYNLYPQAIPFVLLLFVTSVSMLLAIRWERLGGLLTGGGGVALGIFMGLYLSQIATSAECSAIAIVLIGVLWMLPFVIFGALFHQLSQHRPQHLRVA
jgi:hypothetical protein